MMELDDRIDELEREISSARAGTLLGWERELRVKRDELTAVLQELAELRAGQEAAIDEALRQQAAAACKRVELSDPLGPELGAVLALVPEQYELSAGRQGGEAWASWIHDDCETRYAGEGGTVEAAILATTAKLLQLDEGSLRRRVVGSDRVVRAAMAVIDLWRTDRSILMDEEQELVCAVEELRGAPAEPRPKSCRSCVHFERDAPPAASGDTSARPCIAHDSLLTHPDGGAECEDYKPDTDPAPDSPPLLKGVTQPVENLVRSEGDDETT